ncbi:OmpA family protein [Leeuwenhoekiella sp. H156]|uniref:OmpA family protein n=1 Tax=Leeuwenhoekiella sp. H156 TaxID=3450128 RepID=UPI003FA43D0D
MKHILLFLTFALALISFDVNAQERELERANKKFDQYAFVDSQKIYLKVAEEGYASAELFGKLGDSFYYNADYAEAAQWYGKLVEAYADQVTPEQYFRYAQSLRAIERYDTSLEMIALYKAGTSGGDEQIYENGGGQNYVAGTYSVEKLGINKTGYSDFGAAYYGEQILFASTRDTGVFSTRIHLWNKQPFLDLYTADVQSGKVTNVQKLTGPVNTPYHESNAVLNADGTRLYFTRNNYSKEQFKTSKNNTNKLKIYVSARNDSSSEWGEAKELPINSDEFSTSHPALSPDGKTLYFASDRPGGYGESDLWSVSLEGDTILGEPSNLGPTVNTPGRDGFPYVSQLGLLYFSSDGRAGLGGLDVFVLNENKIQTLGSPINSTSDDFAFVINESDNTGYLSSNRANDPLDDDIYSFLKQPCETMLTVTIIDDVTKKVLSQAQVEIRNEQNEILNSGLTSGMGEYSFNQIPCGDVYFVRASKEGYSTEEQSIEVSEDEEEITMALIPEKIEAGFDLAVLIEPIYFDFDKSNIRPDAAVELQKIIQILKEYPGLRIDVRSHTDSRGDDDYNMALSQRRNESTIQYIIEEGGISADRISGRGYGESQLLNECSNGVACSEEQHQLNRRSQFIVLDN